MTKRKRKPLDDALAEDFVYGENQPKDESVDNQPPAPTEEVKSIPPTTAEKKDKESSLMDKLQAKPKEATKRFTVDLEESLHRDLSILAAETGRTKADIVRILLKDAVQSIKKSRQ